MADHLYRPRPSASSGPLLWLTLAASLLAHLLILSLGGGAAAPDRRPDPPRRARSASAWPPSGAGRAADGTAGRGRPRRLRQQRRAGTAAQPPRAAQAQACGRDGGNADACHAHRPADARPAKVQPPPPSGQVSTGSLLAQVGALSRGGDSAMADSDKESGQAGNALGEAARGYPWARYQADWRLKVERIGNLNYPEEARRQGLHGAVTLEVTIAADGSLQGQRVTRSSGSPVLDDAAQRIVELSSPFPPFPPALARARRCASSRNSSSPGTISYPAIEPRIHHV
ncbi:TonB family C-terminal domain [Chromobacterium violaceum]|uniref:TonB family C-terminal domain n=1 Tax=Chromobacterium violaceum TaxID=536 RepID=A0A3S4LPH9_CHRVL|nr:TonB family C-terminal domain [Chromobacterium violaceum]